MVRSFALWAVLSCGIAAAQNATSNPTALKQARLQKHSATFAWFDGGPRPDGSIEKLQPNGDGEMDLSGGTLADYPDVPPGSYAPPSDEALIVPAAKRAVLVVRATALSFQSALTPGRSFIYSDWDFQVAEVFKNDSSQTAQTGDTITITRTGGRLTWNGRVAFAHDMAFPDFTVNAQYVLFLVRVPEDESSFRAVDWGSCRLDPERAVCLSDPRNRRDGLTELAKRKTVADFLSVIRRTVR